MGGQNWVNVLYGDFGPFLGVKNALFGSKLHFFAIFEILLLSASASLCSFEHTSYHNRFETMKCNGFHVLVLKKNVKITEIM